MIAHLIRGHPSFHVYICLLTDRQLSILHPPSPRDCGRHEVHEEKGSPVKTHFRSQGPNIAGRETDKLHTHIEIVMRPNHGTEEGPLSQKWQGMEEGMG